MINAISTVTAPLQPHTNTRAEAPPSEEDRVTLSAAARRHLRRPGIGDLQGSTGEIETTERTTQFLRPTSTVLGDTREAAPREGSVVFEGAEDTLRAFGAPGASEPEETIAVTQQAVHTAGELQLGIVDLRDATIG